MSKSPSNEIKRGQTIAFRVPSDTPDYLLKQLQNLKETEKRNFSSKIAEFVMDGITQTLKKERETITIPLPLKLTKAQRDWLKHAHSEALLGSILYQLISDPVRTASLLASLNSNAVDIDEALYLQEEEVPSFPLEEETVIEATKEIAAELDDDLDKFDWNNAKKEQTFENKNQNEESLDDLLGGFLARMNR